MKLNNIEEVYGEKLYHMAHKTSRMWQPYTFIFNNNRFWEFVFKVELILLIMVTQKSWWVLCELVETVTMNFTFIGFPLTVHIEMCESFRKEFIMQTKTDKISHNESPVHVLPVEL